MEQFLIKGNNKLNGSVKIDGAKNSALPLIAAAILPGRPVTLKNTPEVSDVYNMLDALREIGATVSELKDGKVTIDGSTINSTTINYENMKKIRASYYLIGALLARFGKAEVPMPGGCDLGNRPIDQHLKGFRKLGVNINCKHGMIEAKANKDALVGKTIFMDIVSVGATINIMLAASTAKGTTTIINAAKEPHVIDVANFLNRIGVNVRGAGSDRIRITGGNELLSTVHEIIPDQIEAATFMIAAAGTGSTIKLENIVPSHLVPISSKLIEAGCNIYTSDTSLIISGPEKLIPISVITNPHPGFPTDAQPQITAALTNVEDGKTSIIKENIFTGRFNYVAELVKMGAEITTYDKLATITGKGKLQGAIVESPDLRAGAALIIAGLMAEGETYIRNIHFIKRGYVNIDEKLRQLGADIKICNY